MNARDRYRHAYAVLRRYVSLDEDDEYWEYRDGTPEGNAYASLVVKGDEFTGWTPGSRERKFRRLIYRSTLTGYERKLYDEVDKYERSLMRHMERAIFGLREGE